MPRLRPSEFALLAMLALPASAGAQQQAVAAVLACAPREGKGRVLCELSLNVAAGRLTWADLVVERAPEFARPLRSRVSGRAAAERSGRSMRLPFALMAERPGQGLLVIQARAVTCLEVASSAGGPGQSCSASLQRVETAVRVSQTGGE
jgi:hypothetical protein